MTLREEVEKAIADELATRDRYRELARKKRAAGHFSAAEVTDRIADDEDRHANMFITMLQASKEEREELKLGERMIEVPLGQPGYYWEVTNMIRGDVLQNSTKYSDSIDAIQAAKDSLREYYSHFGDDHLVIKVFTQSPDEREGMTYTPVVTESFWVSEAPRPFWATDRPVPKTYGDWNDLGMDIKEKAGVGDFKTTAEVNEHLYHIWRGKRTRDSTGI